MTEEEKINDEQIPAEVKEQLNSKVASVLNKIALVEKAVNDAIDDVVDDNSDFKFTTTEIQAALLNVLRKMNSREIMQLIK